VPGHREGLQADDGPLLRLSRVRDADDAIAHSLGQGPGLAAVAEGDALAGGGLRRQGRGRPAAAGRRDGGQGCIQDQRASAAGLRRVEQADGRLPPHREQLKRRSGRPEVPEQCADAAAQHAAQSGRLLAQRRGAREQLSDEPRTRLRPRLRVVREGSDQAAQGGRERIGDVDHRRRAVTFGARSRAAVARPAPADVLHDRCGEQRRAPDLGAVVEGLEQRPSRIGLHQAPARQLGEREAGATEVDARIGRGDLDGDRGLDESPAVDERDRELPQAAGQHASRLPAGERGRLAPAEKAAEGRLLLDHQHPRAVLSEPYRGHQSGQRTTQHDRVPASQSRSVRGADRGEPPHQRRSAESGPINSGSSSGARTSISPMR
jgi:hypothetical protein